MSERLGCTVQLWQPCNVLSTLHLHGHPATKSFPPTTPLQIHKPYKVKGEHAMQHFGQVLPGDIVRIKHNPVILHTRSQLHCCTPWKHGPRTTLTAFTTLSCRNTPEPFRHTAREHLKLPFPCDEDLDLWAREARQRATEGREAPGFRQTKITRYSQAPN